MTELPHAVATTVVHVEEREVVLQTADGQTLRYPRRLLPEDITAGATVHLVAFADLNATAERERLARVVLSEMLRGE
jgi:hypothetical protein